MKDIINTHRQMVLRLAKPGEAILKSLNDNPKGPMHCHLTHMAGCIPGEAAELYDAICDGLSDKSDDPVEELGDFAFYLAALQSLFSLEWTGKAKEPSLAPADHCVELMRIGGHLWDVVKRIVVYQKDAGLADAKYDGRTLFEVAQDLLRDLETEFGAIVTLYDLTLEEVLEANWTKLADSGKGRYSSGAYSDQQAQDRKDKH